MKKGFEKRVQIKEKQPKYPQSSNCSEDLKLKKIQKQKEESKCKKGKESKEKSSKHCSICYNEISVQGKLSSCRHEFCITCIKQWSEIENTCPICKTRFSSIKRRSLTFESSSSPTKRKKIQSPQILNSFHSSSPIFRLPHPNSRNRGNNEISNSGSREAIVGNVDSDLEGVESAENNSNYAQIGERGGNVNVNVNVNVNINDNVNVNDDVHVDVDRESNRNEESEDNESDIEVKERNQSYESEQYLVIFFNSRAGDRNQMNIPIYSPNISQINEQAEILSERFYLLRDHFNNTHHTHHTHHTQNNNNSHI